MKAKLYAMKCTKTGKGFNKGYLCADGTNFKKESDLLEDIRKAEPKRTKGKTDKKVLEESYNLEEYYYSEFECITSMNYIEVEDKLYPIQIYFSNYWNK